MLTPSETTSYERSSNTAAGLCAGCAKVLDDDEVHVCWQCSKEFARRGADESAEGSKL
ncbi:protein NinF [Cedecea sp. P7760]|uniref:protein NinF n=1 Tax=Cedecea sp. P7760 TaxID=2726983 RepID=UPI0015A315D3|nr:NinF family protein [Cedecea sp. P7760]